MRVLSYSFYPFLNSWVSDRFVNEFGRLNCSYFSNGSFSAIYICSSSFVHPNSVFVYGGKKVVLAGVSQLEPILLDCSQDSVFNAIRAIYRSTLIDLVDVETGLVIEGKVCVCCRDNVELNILSVNEFLSECIKWR